ncbi:MAG: hypothetical protein JXB18_10935 [Sedimentisphaerales bacterium]|nr:hypothetical protein [Sedimentisphaerales bacterium]
MNKTQRQLNKQTNPKAAQASVLEFNIAEASGFSVTQPPQAVSIFSLFH